MGSTSLLFLKKIWLVTVQEKENDISSSLLAVLRIVSMEKNRFAFSSMGNGGYVLRTARITEAGNCLQNKIFSNLDKRYDFVVNSVVALRFSFPLSRRREGPIASRSVGMCRVTT